MISTCNRVELYVAADDADRAATGLADVLARRAGVAVADLAEHLYQHRDAAAVRHLFRVASSLDSLVVGEPQILGQTKQAYDAAVQHGTAGRRAARLLRGGRVPRRAARAARDGDRAQPGVGQLGGGRLRAPGLRRLRASGTC